MNIEKVSIDDVEALKELAKSAILASVNAGIDIKKEVIIDTDNNIDRNLTGSNRVFFQIH